MIDIKGFPLSTEQGNPLVTEKDVYRRTEYGEQNALSVVTDSKSFRETGKSTKNKFGKGDGAAALPAIEQFAEQSEVSRTLLGINRETSQQGLFGNVSSYGLDPKDWRVDSYGDQDDAQSRWWWTRRPSSTGNYYPVRFDEDAKNSAIVLSANPTPFLEPPRPTLQDQLVNPGGAERYKTWGEYLNSIIALYLIRYMVENFSAQQRERFNLLPMLQSYPPIINPDGSYTFNELFWDKLWLDIQQNRFGNEATSYPIIPSGKAYNLNLTTLGGWRSNADLWGGDDVYVTEANQNLPASLDVSWDSFFFSTTRVYYPSNNAEENQGHFRLKTNPTADIWYKYHGLRYDQLRQDLKDWEFTIHPNEGTVTQLEKDLKLPYFVLDNPVTPNPDNLFSTTWPSAAYGAEIGLPTASNRIGGSQGVYSEITLKSIRAFRYQPGRISGYTYGVKVSEIGAGPGTIIEFGIENDTDSYMFRLTNGAVFSVVRTSIVPLESTEFFDQAQYNESTKTVIKNGVTQYETVIEQKIMNGDSLGGEGETGYLLNPDTVTMYKIEFGWYGAIGARFYAYVPVENGECRWVTLHTLVIENQLGRPCLGDPFFYFKYRLKVQDSSAIRIDQFINKFGASYYIDGYDEGTLYSLNAQSKVRYLPSPGFSDSKVTLDAIDWTTVMGIKPRQTLINRFGSELYNKKEIFPQKLFVYSQKDCEIKIVRQKACPDWGFAHQEGYYWPILPENRRLKGRYAITPYFELNNASLGISAEDASTHSAVLAYSTSSTGSFRNPSEGSNWDVIGDQVVRVVGEDLFATTVERRSSDSTLLKLARGEDYQQVYLSSSEPKPEQNKVYLPFTFPSIPPYQNGYDVEFDYFRRDQILLSTIDILSDEFYLFSVGGELQGLDANHAAGIRFGFAWPQTTVGQDLYADSSDKDWGIEENATYDGQNFYEGLPYDFAFDYPDNCIYVETNPTLAVDTYNLESNEFTNYYFTDIDYFSSRLSVPGSEGGVCRALLCKAGRELRTEVTIISEEEDGETLYYVSDKTPWPNLGNNTTFQVSISQGVNVANVSTTGGISRKVGDVTEFLLPLGNQLPGGILPSDGSANTSVSYSIVYIASVDKKYNIRSILVSKIAPGNIPFIRLFVQGRQGTTMGGIWVGQKIATGIKVEPFTPHRSTVSITDGALDYHSQWSTNPQTDGAVKAIGTYTHIDNNGVSTAPTIDSNEQNLNTYKSIHTSPKKCGSFLSKGGINSAGIFTASEYPIRWLTSNIGTPISNYYVSADTPTEIDLTDIFNVSAESIVNEDDGNLATFFIARALNNHDETKNEIYVSLNYNEQ